jgi:hypothetical protein
MMKNISKILAITFVAMVFGISAKAQTDATFTATATATIVTPISISNPVALAFGIILPDAAGGTVAIDATTGTPTYAGGSTTGITTTATNATFDVTGSADQAYSIELPADGDVVLSGPGADMAVSGFAADLGTSGTLDATGNQSFQVGATLTIGAAQAAGSYTGSYDVTVTYE